MPIQYNAEEVDRLTRLADVKEQERQSVAKRMRDMTGYSEDAPGEIPEGKGWDTDDLMRFKQLEAQESILAREVTEIKGKRDAMQKVRPADPVETKRKEEADPYLRWARKRRNGLEDHEIKAQTELLADFYKDGSGRASPGVERAFAITDALQRAVITPEASGQNNVQQDVVSSMITYGLHDYGGALDVVSSVVTPNGNTIEYPLYDDGTTKGQVPAGADLDAQLKASQTENALGDFNTVKIEAFPRNTGFVDLSQWANEDVVWDYGTLIREILMMRMGKMIESDLTIGAGTARVPTGFTVRAGEWQPTQAQANLRWQELNTLQYQIDAAYLMPGGARGLHAFGQANMSGFVGYVTTRSFLGVITNIADSQNRPIVIPSITGGPGAQTLFGWPIRICEEIPDKTYAANKKPIYFGNFGYHTFRTSGAGLVIEEHYDSATAINNTSRFLGRMRYDAEYLGPYSAYASGAPANGATAETFKAFKAKTA